MIVTKEKGNKKNTAAMALGISIVLVITVLVFICMDRLNFYKEHFLPHTYINGMDCSDLDAETVAAMLEEEVQGYKLAVLGRDEAGRQVEVGTILAADIRLELQDALAEATELLNQQSEKGWFQAFFGKTEEHFDAVHVTVFDDTALEAFVKSFEAFQQEQMIEPADAYISEYKEDEKGFEIVPEILGTKLDVNAAVSCIKAIVTGGGDQIDLAEQSCYVQPNVFASDEKLLSDLEKMNQWLSAEITYDWNTFEVVVDGTVIKDWIRIDGEEPALDEEAVADFVAENAAKYDTYGKKRTFKTSLDKEVVLATGGFGWKTDKAAVTKELIALVQEGAVTKAEPVYSNTAPVKGMDDIGNSYVEADLSNQHLYLYHNGKLVFETDFVSGKMNSTADCVTPSGVFDITYKTKNAVLKGDDYETPVSYWMPFYGNYGMHDATWRGQFGGEIFLTQGSHGCINLPLASAEKIYSYVYEGYPVICYYY